MDVEHVQWSLLNKNMVYSKPLGQLHVDIDLNSENYQGFPGFLRFLLLESVGTLSTLKNLYPLVSFQRLSIKKKSGNLPVENKARYF